MEKRLRQLESFAVYLGIFWYCFDDWMATAFGTAVLGAVPVGIWVIWLLISILYLITNAVEVSKQAR